MTFDKIEIPLVPWRFRLEANLDHISMNTESVVFDFAKQTISISIRQSVTANCFRQALALSSLPAFTVEALNGDDTVVFAVRPMGLKLESHTFELSYAAPSNKLALHEYVFSYDDLNIGEPVELLEGAPVENSSDPRFPTPAEALSAINAEVLELDVEQERRFTPDHPDEQVDKPTKASKKG